MVKAVGKKIQKKYKRVRDTSLWKFMHSRRQSVNGKFRLCPDTGSACYDCHELLRRIVIPTIIGKADKHAVFCDKGRDNFLSIRMKLHFFNTFSCSFSLRFISAYRRC